MMHTRDTKALWDHLNTTYGISDAGKELYIMESFHDYKMVANKSIVEQAHEIQRLAKELELLKYVILDEVVAGCIIISCLLHGGTSPQDLNTRDIR
jgi:hypothetical protein